MSLLAVSILAADPDAALADARLARDKGADLVEFRVDHLFHGDGDDKGARDALRLANESPLPCIVTCRPTFEGGDYDGDDAARIALYERLGALASERNGHPPRYIDVELATLERSANARQKIRLAVAHDAQPRELSTSLILSLHDFKGRPANLLRRLEAMRAEPAARILKLAWTARSVRDNLELFDILAERDRPTIALAMGPAGLLSRVLAPKFGAFLTFASLRDSSVTAPGQPTIDDILHLYRFRSIRHDSRVFALLGWPVEHSLSPRVHNAAFDALPNSRDVYLPLPVAPDDAAFKATLAALIEHPRLDFTGASVTMPHKEHALRFARERASDGWTIDDAAARAGAVNTLARRPDGAWLAANTDAPAIRDALAHAIPDLASARIAILGAGGAARAAAAALTAAGAHVSIYARSPDKAEAAARDLGAHAAPWEDRHDPRADAFINCTPIGMAGSPDADASPLDLTRLGALPPRTVIFDTVYSPPETPLLRAARAAGLRVIDGAELFIRQAERQSELWTGAAPPPGLFERLVRAGAAS